MSQLGVNISIDDLKDGTSWALIAHSAINHSGDSGTGASGLLAASSDIEAIVLAGGIDGLFLFPDEQLPAGLYLWAGSLEEDGACIGAGERLHPDSMQHWLDHNGAAP